MSAAGGILMRRAHFLRLMWLNCHPISKPAEATVHPQLGLQMEYKRGLLPGGDELMPHPLLFLSIFKTREERYTSLPILLCLQVRKEHISHHFHHSWLTPMILTTTVVPDASVPARACKQIQLPGSCEAAQHLSGFN